MSESRNVDKGWRLLAVELQNNKDMINRKDLNNIMTRMEMVVKKVGDDLHVFQN